MISALSSNGLGTRARYIALHCHAQGHVVGLNPKTSYKERANMTGRASNVPWMGLKPKLAARRRSQKVDPSGLAGVYRHVRSEMVIKLGFPQP